MSQTPSQQCSHCGKEIMVGVLWCPHCGGDARQVLILEQPSAPPLPRFQSPASTEVKNRLQRVIDLWNYGIVGKLVFIVIFSCCCCAPVAGVFNNSSNVGSNPATSDTTNAVALQPASSSVPVTNTSPTFPTAAIRSTEIPSIPGLHPSDVTISLEERDLTCTDADQQFSLYVRTCEGDFPEVYNVRIVLFGYELFTVDYIEASVLQLSATPTDELTKPFLGFLATLPYDNAEPVTARHWVESNLVAVNAEWDVRTTTFSGVRFSVRGTPELRILEIGSLAHTDLELNETALALTSFFSLASSTPPVASTMTASFVPTLTIAATVTATPIRTNTPPPTATPLPDPPTATSQPSGPICNCGSNLYNCGDFPLPGGVSADKCYQYCISVGVGDIHDLDRDNDGDACDAGNR